jgi:hypothetical protein
MLHKCSKNNALTFSCGAPKCDEGKAVMVFQLHHKEPTMIIFDIRLARFSALCLRERGVAFKVSSEGPREFTVDLPWVSVVFTDHRTANASNGA